MSPATVDLNLLRSLDALLEQRSVTLAARQMGLSQPTMSSTLARLRRHFRDDLLIRAGRQYRLTPLALQLRERTRVAVAAADRAFELQADFDPAGSTREFRMVTSDYSTSLFGRRLAAILREEAPRARLRIAMTTGRSAERTDEMLLDHDLLVMPHGFVTDLSHQDLFRDEWMCVVSADNAEVTDALSIEQLESLPWVATYHGPTASTPAARFMRLLGIEPHIQVVAESFLAVPALVAGSGSVAFLQRRLVDRIPSDAGVRALPCPFDAGELVQAMWWHPVHDDDLEHGYLRDAVTRATMPLRDGPGASGRL